MQEIANKRTYNAKHIDNGDGTFTLNAHVGHVHYKDALGNFLDSDINFRDEGDRWVMDKHNYFLTIFKDFAAPQLIRFENHYEGANHAIVYEPHSLVWFRKSDKDVQAYRTQQSVQGVYNASKRSVYYTNAFGPGIDFEISLLRSGFKKEIVIPNKPANAPTPPSANHKLYALFKYTGEGLKVKKPNGTEWGGVELFDSLEGFEIEEQAKPLAKSFIRKAYAVETMDVANGLIAPKRIDLEVTWFLRNGALWQAKQIPIDQVMTFNFPVRMDTVTSYYSGSGDGWAARDAGISWTNTIDGAGTGSGTTDSNSYVAAISDRQSGWRLYHAFYPTDTSGLGSSATITAASLNVYQTANLNTNPCTFSLVETTQASTSALTDSDHTSLVYTDIGSNTIATGSGNNSYRVWNFSDLTKINKTGYTKVGHIGTEAITRVDPGSAGNQGALSLNFSEAASNDPYIEVTYTVGAAFTPRVSFFM